MSSYSVLKLNKPVGITPIDFWLDYRSRNFLQDEGEKINTCKGAICGKLDPMAEGQMIVIVQKNGSIPQSIMDSFCHFEKTYEFGLLIGMSTESDDRMGKIVEITGTNLEKQLRILAALKEYANNLEEQEYHRYSAKRAGNKENINQPLWWWTKNKRLDEIVIPRHKTQIKEFEIMEEIEHVSAIDFFNNTIELFKEKRFNLAVFEIDTIIADWEEKIKNLSENNPLFFDIVNVRCRVTGGTFIRQICCDLQKETGIPMLCSYIRRTEIHLKDVKFDI